MLFSISSFTTEAGRSTTSPAATWLATASGSNRIRLIRFDFRFQRTNCEEKRSPMRLQLFDLVNPQPYFIQR
jgi:hypothetical protein